MCDFMSEKNKKLKLFYFDFSKEEINKVKEIKKRMMEGGIIVLGSMSYKVLSKKKVELFDISISLLLEFLDEINYGILEMLEANRIRNKKLLGKFNITIEDPTKTCSVCGKRDAITYPIGKNDKCMVCDLYDSMSGEEGWELFENFINKKVIEGKLEDKHDEIKRFIYAVHVAHAYSKFTLSPDQAFVVKLLNIPILDDDIMDFFAEKYNVVKASNKSDEVEIGTEMRDIRMKIRELWRKKNEDD